MVIAIGSAAWAIGSADRKKTTQSAILFSAALLRFIENCSLVDPL
jgi:hypothetical protein